MTSAEKTAIVKAEQAHECQQAIIEAKQYIAAYFLVIGEKMQQMRDEALYKFLGHDSFESFLGSPDIAFSRSKAYDLIRIREIFKDRLKIDDQTLLEVGNTKLLLIAPVVEKDKDGWLDKAKHLSKSDLRLELGQGSGKEIGPPQKISPPKSPASAPSSCCVCGSMQWEKHHWPITRGAGAEDGWWIPLCRVCHSSCHHEPKDWTWEHKRSWAKYLYGLINRE